MFPRNLRIQPFLITPRRQGRFAEEERREMAV